MHFCKAVLVSITVVLTLSGSTNGYGLECWACSSIVDKNCAEDFYFGLPDSTVLKKQCWELPRLAGRRNMNATSCTKIVITDHRSTIVNRGCGFPNEFGQNPLESVCKSQSLGHSNGHDPHIEFCTCTESYCNGSNKQTAVQVAILASVITITCLFLMDR